MTADNPYAPSLPRAADQSPTGPLEPPQSVSVVLEAADYLAFVNHLNRSDQAILRLLRRQVVTWLILGGAMLGASFLFGAIGLRLDAVEGFTRVMGITFLVLAAIRLPMARRQARKRTARSLQLGLFGEVDKPAVVSLEPNGLRTRDRGGDGLRYWSGIRRVATTDDHLFLYLLPAQAVILPRRAFQSESHFRQYAALADRLWRSAQADAGESADD